MTSPDRAAHPFDAGLQPERTALAWRRTALALTGGSLVAARVLPPLLGVWSLLPAGAALLLSIGVLVASHHRYRAHHRLLTTADHDRVALPNGVLPALVTGLTILGGGLCLAVVLQRV
ncbi:DUF202 domain-containing protein [Rathayibacter festucae]|uniref:DUF202 domain-containing protein n=1 Tax=Rathayibacter festucae TaxID=110937 RepID=UPI001FB50015|nr:DUF202 domain-containing protein [Rathayibacter festucae]MCJ1700307.1 DUF202 domain-containing protein [Rathayibacter festucae]